nr:amidase [Jannaschia sp. S6380]
MRGGRLRAPDLMADTLDRIAASDLRAIVSLRPRDDLLAEAADPRPGPLSGLPMAIKDLADTAGLRTTYGHPAFADHVPEVDAPMVARLKAAGAIVIGKTNTPEFGLGSHSYNPVHGTTVNPWNPSRSAGGSSGGAGAALAARLVALADGSDMMGSLRNPAAWNNVFGLRPSFGLVPAAPQGDPALHQLATDGPMARTPDDLELLLSVMAAPDARVPGSSGPYRATPAKSLRIGWAGDWGGAYPCEAGILDLCQDALDGLAEPMAPPFPAEEIWTAWTTLRSFAIAEKLRPHWSDAFAARSEPKLVWEVERGLALKLEEVTRASGIRAAWFRRMATLDIDVIALPAAQCFPFDAALDWPQQVAGRSMDTYHRWMEVVVPAALAGLPAICVPVGFRDGLPMGVQLIGRRGADGDLIALARRMHAAAPWADRRPDID